MKEKCKFPVHYVKQPQNHIVIDFDIPVENDNKWPETYAEVSKSGAGIHLHYICEGLKHYEKYLINERRMHGHDN